MRLFWKLFITMLCFVIAAFMVFGNIIINIPFESSLKRETNRSIEEMHIMVYALAASLDGLPDGYQASDTAMIEITKSISQSLESNNGIVIYNEDKEIIYNNSNYESGLINTKQTDGHGICSITEHNGSHYIGCFFEVKSKTGNFYIEIDKEIDFIFEDREILYKNYRIALMILFVFSAVLSFVFSISFTSPVRKLSTAARELAGGNYERRVKPKGNDEVTVLINDFNSMAMQLEDNIHKLEEDARRQEEFTEAFSHELKTPLTSIIGYADMLRSMKLSEEDVMTSAGYIFKEGKRLERLAYKMMELSFADKQKIEIKPVSVEFLAEKIEKSAKYLLTSGDKNISFEVDIEPGVIYGDLDLLQSLFANLVDNARKACREDGKIVLDGRNTSTGYELWVKDNGCGIPDNEIKKITEAFYMVDKSRARKEGGAGIGLALCVKIVNLHNAEFKIISHEGTGTQVLTRFRKQDSLERKNIE